MIERQTLCQLICIHGPKMQWWHFQLWQKFIFQDGGQYGRQITPKAISQLTNMIDRQTLCRLICIHGPGIQWWHFQF